MAVKNGQTAPRSTEPLGEAEDLPSLEINRSGLHEGVFGPADNVDYLDYPPGWMKPGPTGWKPILEQHFPMDFDFNWNTKTVPSAARSDWTASTVPWTLHPSWPTQIVSKGLTFDWTTKTFSTETTQPLNERPLWRTEVK
jgi:hypothetical protein